MIYTHVFSSQFLHLPFAISTLHKSIAYPGKTDDWYFITLRCFNDVRSVYYINPTNLLEVTNPQSVLQRR